VGVLKIFPLKIFPEGVSVKIICYFAEFTGKIQASSKIEEIAWLNYSNRPQCSPVMQLAMDWLKAKKLL